MIAPEKLHGEVWRATVDGWLCVVNTDMGNTWVRCWDERTSEWFSPAAVFYTQILLVALRAMMAERDAARVLSDELDDKHKRAAAERDVARAEVARLRGLPPSLPGYGHDEEPAEDRDARERQWAGAERPEAAITEPREP